MARSQNLHLCRKISSDCTHQLEISDSSRASTPEKICLHQFFNLLLLLAGDLPLKRSLKGIYDLQSKDLPMLRRDVHVWVLEVEFPLAGVWTVGEGVVAGWAYGVAATFLPHKGGAVPESEKRRAAWCTASTSHTCLFAPFLGRGPGGRRARGAGCGAVRAVVCLASCCVCSLVPSNIEV